MEVKTKLDWNSFKDQFGNWSDKIKPFFDEGGFDEIYKFLKHESRRGKKLTPLSSNTFRCFQETDFNNLKLIVVGLSPYHTLRNGEPVADGLCLSCSITKILQPSLDQWYNCVEEELYKGMNIHYIKNPDLTFLARQGVLLLNAGLTCEIMKPASHNLLWEPFMKYLFEKVLDVTGTPTVFLGKEASKLKKYVMPFTWTFEISHPAAASYRNEEWSSESMFKSVNQILKSRHNYEINWLDINDCPF